MTIRRKPNVPLAPGTTAQQLMGLLMERQTMILHAIQTQVGLRILQALVVGNEFGNPTGTPVRTGFARGSWHLGVGTLPTDEGSDEDPSGAATMARGAAVVATAPFALPIHYANWAPYFYYLEYGRGQHGPWSAQAPAGVVRIVVANFKKLVEDVVSEFRAAGFPVQVT